jgi:hypothetical protein
MAEDEGPKEGITGGITNNDTEDATAVVLVPAAAVGHLMYPAAVAEILRVPPANDLLPREGGS